jgi:serine/threonine-protein kinase
MADGGPPSSAGTTILSRGVSSPAAPLSQNQVLVDQLVSNSLTEATKGSTLTAMVGAGWVFRFARAGVLSLAPLTEGSAYLPTLLRGGSFATAFAAESATFTGIERSARLWEGPSSQESFLKEWGRSATNLGSLKILGGFARGQNVILEHFLSDLGMVAGNQLGSSLGLNSKSEGSFAEQMIQAEALNWSMKGGMHLVSSLAPGLSASEQSMDLYLRSQEKGLSSQTGLLRSYLKSAHAFATAGALEIPSSALSMGEKVKGSSILLMSNEGDGGQGGNKPKPKLDPHQSIRDSEITRVLPPVVPAQSVTKVQPLQAPPPKVVIRPLHDSVTKEQPLQAPAPQPQSPDLLPKVMVETPPDPYVGMTISDRYFVEKMLGAGGMGKVYRCRHLLLDKNVAMKVLHPDVAQNPENAQRFLNEARAAGRIGSNHIVEISDVGQMPSGEFYLVMELLQGKDLYKTLYDESAGQAIFRPMPFNRLIEISKQIAEGLSDAHKADIVHRDLKPENIFLVQRPSRRGKDSVKDEVKILDFGLAKMSSVMEPTFVGATAQPKMSHKLTRATSVFGTPAYMPPEQIVSSQAVDKRADIYSFGAMLHEMASGQWVFSYDPGLNDPTAIASNLMAKHQAAAPPRLRAVVPKPEEIPEAFETLVLRCLEKDPDKRYQTMDEVLDALIKIQEEYAAKNPVEVKTITSDPPRPPLNKNLKIYAGAGLGLALGAVTLGAIYVFALKSNNNQDSDGGAPVAPSAPASSAPAISPPKKPVVLSVDPADAHVFRGDQELDKPVLMQVELGNPVELEVRLDGYLTKKVILDGGQDKLLVHLEPDPAAKSNKPKPKTTAYPTVKPKPPTPKPSSWPNGVDDPWIRK